MQIDIWEVEKGSLNNRDGSRAATDREVMAYMIWQRRRRGLPESDSVALEWANVKIGGKYARLCLGATFGRMTSPSKYINGGTEYVQSQFEEGAYSLVMPGHDAHRQTVTMETLSEAGEVVARSTMPLEPKKGGVIWSREDVRAAHGKIAKGQPRIVPDHIEQVPEKVASEAQEPQGAPSPVMVAAEAIDAPHGQEIVSKPIFRSLEDFKRAAVIGSRWRKALWRDGAWDYDASPITRTVAKVQQRDIGFIWGDRTAAEAENIGHEAYKRGNLTWLGIPKRGMWSADSTGIVILYPDGTPNCRFDLLLPLDTSAAASAALQEPQEALAPTMTAPEPLDAPSGPEIAPEAINDPLTEVLARLAALESQIASLSAERVDTPIGGMSGEVVALPVAGAAQRLALAQDYRRADRARRERIARRYLAMRADRERARQEVALWKAHCDNWADEVTSLEQANQRLKDKRRASVKRAMTLQRERDAAHLKAASAMARIEMQEGRIWEEWDHRRRNAERARRMVSSARAEAKAANQSASASRAALAALRARLADPAQPERASDIARLMQERDTARNALAALQQRNTAMQSALDSSAKIIEDFGLRLAKAEAAVRSMAA